MKILLIDEDKQSMRYYLQEMDNAGFQVSHCRSVDEALDLIAAEIALFQLIILDSAMPPGLAYAEKATEDGTLTGKYLFADIREKAPNTPILILTNFSSLDWIQAATQGANVQVARKIDMLPTELVATIKLLVQKSKK